MRTSVDVHNFLLEHGVDHELVPVQGRLRTPGRAAAVLGLPTTQVGRVILYRGEVGGAETLVAALVRADRLADPSKVAGALGGDPLEELASEDATDLTGFLPEAMPPVALPAGTKVVIDSAFGDEDILYFPGGEATSVLKIRSADLVRALEASVSPITA